MQYEKSEQIVVRLPESMKKKIAELAEKKEIKVSELVRQSLEHLINEVTSEILNQMSIIQTIEMKLERHINQLIFVKNGHDDQLKKTIRLYMKLVTEEKENVIEMIGLEYDVQDHKTKKLIDQWTSIKKQYESMLEDNNEDIDVLLCITNDDQKMKSLENNRYQVVGKLYTQVSQNYKSNKKM